MVGNIVVTFYSIVVLLDIVFGSTVTLEELGEDVQHINKYDAIIASEVLEHINDVDHFIANIGKLLKVR
jgi:2-polyprenyl-3-methyl-5-hydroxy-6-metoxy-1,4-benzoquinol methylase